MQGKRTISALLLVAFGATACYTRVPVANVSPIRLEAKTGRPSADGFNCPAAGAAAGGSPGVMAAAGVNRRERAAELNRRARDLAVEDRLAAAVPLWEQAAALDPDNAQVAFNLGLAYERTERAAAAVGQYCRYLALAPDASNAAEVRRRAAGLLPYPADVPEDAASHFRVGFGYAQRGELEAAARAYDRAIELAPDWADAYFNRAIVFEARRRPDEATRDLERYLTLAPQAPDRLVVRDKLRSFDAQYRKTLDVKKTLGLVTLVGAVVIGVVALATSGDDDYYGPDDPYFDRQPF